VSALIWLSPICSVNIILLKGMDAGGAERVAPNETRRNRKENGRDLYFWPFTFYKSLRVPKAGALRGISIATGKRVGFAFISQRQNCG
jgi:hypothetical protein